MQESISLPYTIQGYIRLYRCLGFNVFPLKPHKKDEFLTSSWKEFQIRIITEQEIGKFWPGITENNVAIVTGSISGNLWVLDFDTVEAYEKAFTPEERKKLEESTLVVKTGKGVHVYFRAKPEIEVKNQAHETPFGHVDVRGTGGYVVAAPSWHPNGKQYSIISKVLTIQGADPSLLDLILKNLGATKKNYSPAASTDNEAFKLALVADEELRELYAGNWQKWIKKTRSEAEFRLVRKLVKVGFSDATICEIMETSAIGKWNESAESYRKLTIEKARRSVINQKLLSDMKEKVKKRKSFVVQDDGSVRLKN